jgi:aldehyde:ferredoxin oxidoreductase
LRDENMAFHGLYGKVLEIDLGTRRVTISSLDEKTYCEYLGGAGLAAKLIHDRVRTKIGPLEPANPLVFAVGPLTGSPAPCSGRHAVAAISPLTEIWGEGTSGGVWGRALRSTGFDAVTITGKSESPVYLSIQGSKVQIQSASHLWGKDCYETQNLILSEEGKKARVACIGVGGEKLVKYACIINEGRKVGRAGLGAVMGSKNLKGVCVQGEESIPVADPENFRNAASRITKTLTNSPWATLQREYGTIGYLDMGMFLGDAPARYFTRSVFPVEKITSKALRERFVVKFEGCFGCPVHCGRKVHLDVPYVTQVDGPEYESAVALGPLCMNFDLSSVVFLNHLCNLYGIDTISTGVCLAFGMFLLDDGGMKESDLGFRLDWGDKEGMERMIHRIARREGPGDLLAEGVRKIAATLSVDPELAAHVKGLEIPMHDPRAFEGLALSYATGPRGACHLHGDFYSVDLGTTKIPQLGLKAGNRFSIDGRVDQVIKLQNLREVYNSLAICLFPPIPLEDLLLLINTMAGWSIGVEDLDRIGSRIFNVKRLISITMGVRSVDDRLPGIVRRPYPEGGTEGHVNRIEEVIDEYYKLRKWDGNGIPTEEV